MLSVKYVPWHVDILILLQFSKNKELNQTIDRALGLSTQEPVSWQKLMKQGMSKDFSWRSAAKEYVRQYKASLAATKL